MLIFFFIIKILNPLEKNLTSNKYRLRVWSSRVQMEYRNWGKKKPKIFEWYLCGTFYFLFHEKKRKKQFKLQNRVSEHVQDIFHLVHFCCAVHVSRLLDAEREGGGNVCRNKKKSNFEVFFR